jgi:hypothetical protein
MEPLLPLVVEGRPTASIAGGRSGDFELSKPTLLLKECMKYTVEGDRIVLDLTWEEIEKIPGDLPVHWEVGTGYVMPNDPEVLARVKDAVRRPLQPRVRELIR